MADPSLNEALNRAITDLNELVEAANGHRSARDQAQVRLDEADEEVRKQTTLVESLRAAAERYGDAEPTMVTPADATAKVLKSMARTDAIVFALGQIGKPVGPSYLTKWLGAHGRNDRPGAVGATLGHLATQGRIRSLGYGQWVVSDKPYTEAVLVSDEAERRLREAFPGAAPGQ